MHYREVGRRRTGENALSTWSANEGSGRRAYDDLGLAFLPQMRALDISLHEPHDFVSLH